MDNWQQILVTPGTTLRVAMERINEVGSQIALVVDDHRRLVGTLSDGDARRALLAGVTLDDVVSKSMHPKPISVFSDEVSDEVLGKMRRNGLHQIPVIDRSGVVVGLQTIDDFLSVRPRSNCVVIMAGGLGTRLEALTQDTPKPMLTIGSRPILEILVKQLADQGFADFYIAVNYKAEQIVSYFGDGERFGIRVRYLHEPKRMGTAGALSLIEEPIRQPFLVTNADLLIKEDIARMVDVHAESGATATMGVRTYDIQVPFGVVREQDGRVMSIEEKPVFRQLVSAGINVFSPEVLAEITGDQYLDMPSLFSQLLERKRAVRAYHMNGYWLDIGRPPDLARANAEFFEVFT